jgi:hypothetical protein
MVVVENKRQQQSKRLLGLCLPLVCNNDNKDADFDDGR